MFEVYRIMYRFMNVYNIGNQLDAQKRCGELAGTLHEKMWGVQNYFLVNIYFKWTVRPVFFTGGAIIYYGGVREILNYLFFLAKKLAK